jgi:hypothetical protein
MALPMKKKGRSRKRQPSNASSKATKRNAHQNPRRQSRLHQSRAQARAPTSRISRSSIAISNPEIASKQRYKCKFHRFETTTSSEWRRHLNTIDHRQMTVMHENNIFFIVRSREIKRQ